MPNKAQDSENQDEKATGGNGGAGEGDEGEGNESDRALDGKVNAALDSHLSKFKKSLERDFTKKTEAMLQGAMSPLAKQLEEIAKRLSSPAPSKRGKEEDDSGHSAKLEEERKLWQGKIAELEGAVNSERKLREEGEAKQRTQEEKHALTSALSAAGITGAKQRAAIALLYTEDKRVARNEDGEIGFTVQKAGYTEHVTLEEGINQWLKTDEGKEFLPARGAGGSGNVGSRAGGRGPKTKAERQAMAKLDLAAAMGVRPGDLTE